MVKCLFFAQLADDAEQASIEIEYQQAMTPRDLVKSFETTLPKQLIDSLLFDAVMVSVNQVFATWDDSLADGDEVAFLPPFSGG